MRKIFSVFLMTLTITLPGRAMSLINDTETERVLTNLIMPLATAANIPASRLHIYIINDDDFNAFVRGGEDIYIYTGLLKQIKSPDALQAVVAHELAHTLGGHVAQMSARMDAEMKRAMLIQALGIGLMVAGGNPSLGAGVLAGSEGIATQSMMAFSRDEERIADNMGVDLMIRAKQNPYGFIDVFEQIRNISGALESQINPNVINHPLTNERLKNVREYIEKNAQNFTPDRHLSTQRAAEYELVRAKLIGYLDQPERVRSLYPPNNTSDAAIYARTIADMQSGHLVTAATGAKTLLSRQPKNPYFYELMGDIEYQSGNYDASITAYENSLLYAPNAPQIQTALALVLTERNRENDAARANELCKRALLQSPAPLTYWVLARTYNDGRADWAMAEYYNMQGQDSNARRYATQARKKLPKDSPEYIKAGDILNQNKKK